MTTQAEKSLASATKMIAEGDHGRAFAHLLLALTLQDSLKGKEGFEEHFVDCLRSWSAELVSLQREKDALWCFQQACEVWPESGIVLHAAGQFLFQSGYRHEGMSYLERACRVTPHPDWLWDFQNAASSLVERWHFRMLNDRRRNQAYFDALRRAVDRGHQRILDIGSGTGILSMLAVRAGATDVTACEMDTVMYDLSKQIIQKNAMEGNISLRNVKSTDMHPQSQDERFSLVVTEIADAGLLGEGLIPTLQHAWEHLLQPVKHRSQRAPPSLVIPAGATVYIQIIESSYIRKQHRFIRGDGALGSMPVVTSRCVPLIFDPSDPESGGDTEPYSSENLNRIPGGWRPLSAPQQVYDFDFCHAKILTESHLRERTVSIPAISSGRADAVVSWFELHLDAESSVSSSPDSGSCWEQAVYPIHQDEQSAAPSLDSGDTVEVTCRCHPTWMSFSASLTNGIRSKTNSSAQLTDQLRQPDSDCCRTGLEAELIADYRTDGSCNNDICSDQSSSKGSNCSRLAEQGSEGPQDILQISSKDVALLNDKKYLEFLRDSATYCFNETEKTAESGPGDQAAIGSRRVVLDMTGLGLISLLSGDIGIPREYLVHVISDADREPFVDAMIKRNKDSLGNFRHISGDMCEQAPVNDDVRIVVSHLVDSSGVLKENALEDLYMACGQGPVGGVQVIPDVLRIHAVCVESEELRRNTRVTGTEPTLGLDVTLINEYKTSTQLDVCLSKLVHQPLTEHFVALDINLNQLLKKKNPLELFAQKRDSIIKVKSGGRMTSLVYWFEIRSGRGHVISTLDEDTHWLQAAFMLNQDIQVQRGDKIRITSNLKNDALSFTVEMMVEASSRVC